VTKASKVEAFESLASMRPSAFRLAPPALAVVLAFSWGLPRPAQAGPAPSGQRVATLLVLTILPHDVGLLISRERGDLDLGWTIQVPVSERHRIVANFDWSPSRDHHAYRGRLGYRLAGRIPFVGAGATLDGSGLTWSPELGVSFGREDAPLDKATGMVHLLARPDIEPNFSGIRAVTVLLGWTLF